MSILYVFMYALTTNSIPHFYVLLKKRRKLSRYSHFSKIVYCGLNRCYRDTRRRDVISHATCASTAILTLWRQSQRLGGRLTVQLFHKRFLLAEQFGELEDEPAILGTVDASGALAVRHVLATAQLLVRVLPQVTLTFSSKMACL